MNPELLRVRSAGLREEKWRAWGPYVSERAWGTVREDYSEWGEAWEYFPHDHARSRTYRWNEDGLAGICDDRQTFCFGLALWNGNDPILKERIFGLTGHEGNHGEDAKEYWWYVDSTPTHSWMTWRYHYPQREFPYGELVSANQERGRDVPEFELLDTGVFDEDRYWAITVDYAKAGPTDICARITVANRGPEAATLHVLPTLWFRNTWAWGLPGREDRPLIQGATGVLKGQHKIFGSLTVSGDGEPAALLCDNETNAEKLWSLPNRSPYPKDGINDHVIHGAQTINPQSVGTKGALHYVLDIPAGGQREIKIRITQGAPAGDFDDVIRTRQAEADQYFAELIPAGTPPEEVNLARAAVAGLMWSKQFYHFDVARWLDGDPASAPPPEARKHGRNASWRHMSSFDVISMPDKWEYPWYAAWDLAFHCVAIARVDPQFAKEQMLLLLKDWYLHPNGQIPAYEWAFGDVNPPVHAWAALKVFELDGSRDYVFLSQVMHKLMLNFTWWVNRKDSDGNNLFEGGFLGLDNIGPFDRSAALPVAGTLEQSDSTAWMAMYALNLLEMSLVLATWDPVWADIATKFFEHFAFIANAARELWDDEDGFSYDHIRQPDGKTVPMKVRSIVGLLPLCATTTLSSVTLVRLPELAARLRWFLSERPEFVAVLGERRISRDGQQQRLLSAVSPSRRARLLARLFDPEEFLSPHGLRTLSRGHLTEPFSVRLGETDFTIGYEPAESQTGTFGGNSNWRGPIWYPINYLLLGALRQFGTFYHDDLHFDFPTRSGEKLTLHQIADNLSDRLISLFLPGSDGVRPIWTDQPRIAGHPDWESLLVFPEYFNGDTGAALGAWHQTGWTGLVLDLILSRQRNQPPAL